MDLISVIVPVYKVEKYLQECIDSIIAQTYTNLEIILVDDGSPDSCGRICDEYAEKDNRIKVIHQKNCGVSIARNAGLNNAIGDYIGFVDSDDYLESNMFEELYNCLKTYGSDIAICGVKKFEKSSRSFFYGNKTIDKSEFLQALLKEDIASFLCNKLFKKELFDGIRFPEGEVFEDIKIFHLIGEKVSSVSLTDGTFYNYRIREGSITYSNRGKINEWLAATHTRSERYKNTEFYVYAVAGEFRCVRVIVSEMAESDSKSDTYKQLCKKAEELYKICKSQLTGIQRIISVIFLVSPKLYNTVKKIMSKFL